MHTGIQVFVHLGKDIAIIRNEWNQVLDILEENEGIREWVMQRYIEDTLLVGGHKFHLRVYVVCVGAIRVFVCKNILMLLAAHECVAYSEPVVTMTVTWPIVLEFCVSTYLHRYDKDDMGDLYRHLTNTVLAAELEGFDENRVVKVLQFLAVASGSHLPIRFLSLLLNFE